MNNTVHCPDIWRDDLGGGHVTGDGGGGLRGDHGDELPGPRDERGVRGRDEV